jgi:hypothetical protein
MVTTTSDRSKVSRQVLGDEAVPPGDEGEVASLPFPDPVHQRDMPERGGEGPLIAPGAEAGLQEAADTLGIVGGEHGAAGGKEGRMRPDPLSDPGITSTNATTAPRTDPLGGLLVDGMSVGAVGAGRSPPS